MNTGLLLAAQSESEVASVHRARDGARHAAAYRAHSGSAEAKHRAVARRAGGGGSGGPRQFGPRRGSDRHSGQRCGDSEHAQFHARSRTRGRPCRRSDRSSGQGSTRARWRCFSSACSARHESTKAGAPAYLRTHPLTYERIADIQNRLENVPYRQVADSWISSLCGEDQGGARPAQRSARFFRGKPDRAAFPERGREPIRPRESALRQEERRGGA